MPIKISPGQGLLLLIEHYHDDIAKVEQLKKLYLSGAETPAADAQIRELLADAALSSYEISYDAKTINDDPTRRYFETHLAYESLRANLAKIDVEDLKKHVANLIELLPKMGGMDFYAEYAEPVLNGEYRSHDPSFDIEFGSYIQKLKEGKLFDKLPAEEKEKIELLVKSAFLAVIAMEFSAFPLDIYNTGVYSKESRGKVLTEDKTARSQHLGLMKGHMPLASDDVAHEETVTPYVKPSEQSTYKADAAWVRENFARLVHPFSNSISGTMLAQLRVLAKFRDEGKVSFTESSERIARFSQLFASTLLFGSGGHSLYEFTTPLTLPETRAEFSTTPGMEDISLESMYHQGNEAGFDAALQDTINYNKMVLLRKTVQAELTSRPKRTAGTAAEKLELQQGLIQTVHRKKDSYAQLVEQQHFSSLRTKSRKNKIIQPALEHVIACVKAGNIPEAQRTIRTLGDRIRSEFGTTNFWGQPSESYKLIKSLERDLESYGHKLRLVSFKSEMAGLRGSTDEEGDTDTDHEGPARSPYAVTANRHLPQVALLSLFS